MNAVIDASVAAKWLVPESDSEQAEGLLVQWKQGDLDVLAPEILSAEISSMLWKNELRGRLSPYSALLLYEKFKRISLPLTPIDDLVEPALKMALQYGHSVYDGLYVALAQVTGWILITADEKLCALLARKSPQVRLLRDWA